MNKKRIYAVFFLFCGLAVSASSQTVSLDAGLKNCVTYFEGRLPKGTKLAILNFSSESPSLSEYVIEEVIGYLVNSRSLALVERDNKALELLQQEMNFQFSGEVSDATVLAIGKKLGAQTVITGSINLAGDAFRLRIRAIDVESAVIQGQFNTNIVKERYLVSLYNMNASSAANNTAPNGTSAPARTPVQPDNSGSGGGRIRLPDYLMD